MSRSRSSTPPTFSQASSSRRWRGRYFSFADLEAPLARRTTGVLAARIYDLKKSAVDLQLYITDATGRVVFDTRQPSAVGADYSRFHDVKWTLEGKYGVRATQQDPKDAFSTWLYVGAPIYSGGR